MMKAMKLNSQCLRKAKGQAALDFMVSYGIALIIIAVAIYIVFSRGIFNAQLIPPHCYPSAGFVCAAYSLSYCGILTLNVSQAIAPAINITSIACSSSANATGNKPATGNVNLLSYKNAAQFYPSNALKGGFILYGSSPARLQVYCYQGNGQLATGSSSIYSGIVWINYTYPSAPGVHSVSEIVTFAAQHT